MKVAVIGGGFTGRFLAYYLRRENHDVTMVEKEKSVSPTSVYNAGLITPSFSPAPPIGIAKVASTMAGPRGPLYISLLEVLRNSRWFLRALRAGVSAHEKEVMELGRKSIELYNSFFAEENPKVDLQRGIIGLYKDGDLAKRTAGNLGNVFVDEKGIAEMGYKGLGGGVFAKDEISVEPSKLYDELQRRIEELGVKTINGSKATMEDSGRKATASLENGDELVADEYVVASGAMSKQLLSTLGFDPNVLPARGLSLIYDAGGERIVPTPTLFEDYGIALIQHDSTRIRLTSFFEMVGFKNDFAEDRKDWLERTATSHLPKLTGLKLIHQGTGFRPCTPDQIPLIGRVPGFDNVFVATGNCRLGVTLAPVTAYIIASLIGGREPADVPWTLFDPARFS